jgi:hypothetical protein
MSIPSFYPNILSIVEIDRLPNELNFLQDELQTVLEKIYYKDLQFIKSEDSSHGFYDIVLVTSDLLKIRLGNSDFALILNPLSIDESRIPLKFNYTWPILTYFKDFNLTNFSYSVDVLKEIFNEIVNVSEGELIEKTIFFFEGGLEEGEHDYQSYKNFVDKVNQKYLLTGSDILPYPTYDDDNFEMIEGIRISIEENIILPDSIWEIINDLYIYIQMT